MSRLLSFPEKTGITSITPVSGPNARNSGSNTASDGSEQVFNHIGDVVALNLTFRPQQGLDARRERGWLTAFLGGKNATRFQFVDADKMSLSEAGQALTNIDWSGGVSWSTGSWGVGYPVVTVSASATLDTGIIELSSEYWGHNLGLGDYIGFMPFHFGMYTITEVISTGKYRIWPRLRKSIGIADYATLKPTLVMRPLAQSAISMKRGLVSTEGQSITLVEVFDYDVRSHFGD